MCPPDVALISPYPPPGARHTGNGGVPAYAANLAHALRAEGADVTVIAPFEEDAPVVHEDDRIVVRRSFPRSGLALPRAAGSAIETGAPIVHLQHEMFLYGDSRSILGLPVGLRMLRAAGVGPVVTMHQVVDTALVDSSFTRLHRVRVPAILARAGLASVQGSIRRLTQTTIVHERSFVDAVPKAEVVPHGVEMVTPPDRGEAHALLGLDERATVLCFGYVAPYKGLEAALAAAELVADEVNLVVAGGEHPRLAGRDDYARALRRRFGDVARFTGYVSEADVGRWFAASDLALLPYPRPFSSSGALALAVAYGTPLLVSNELAEAAGLPRSLSTSIEPCALAEKLLALARGGPQLELLRSQSKSLAQGRSWPVIARRHLELYKEVTDAARASGRRVRAA